MQATAPTPNPIAEKLILPFHLKVLHIISGDLWAGAEVQAYTLLTSLPKECELFAVLMNHGELEQRLIAAGVKTVVIDERSHSGFQITSQLVTLIKQFRPDIIHTHRKKENILGSLANVLASKNPWRRTKSVRTTHGADEHTSHGLKKLVTKLDNFCGEHLQDAIISVSKDLAAKLQRTFSQRKIHVIENGVDIEKLRTADPAKDLRKDYENHTHIGIIGRLEPVKRVDLFIQVAHQILAAPIADLPKVRFHIIGDGKLKDELVTLTICLGIADDIVFHGHRSDSIEAIAALDIVIMCSDHEGTPMTALETLALGKPLIAHNVGGLREILSENSDLLVDEHTPASYSAKIIELIKKPRPTALNEIYTSAFNARRTLSLYQTIMRKKTIASNI